MKNRVGKKKKCSDRRTGRAKFTHFFEFFFFNFLHFFLHTKKWLKIFYSQVLFLFFGKYQKVVKHPMRKRRPEKYSKLPPPPPLHTRTGVFACRRQTLASVQFKHWHPPKNLQKKNNRSTTATLNRKVLCHIRVFLVRIYFCFWPKNNEKKIFIFFFTPLHKNPWRHCIRPLDATAYEPLLTQVPTPHPRQPWCQSSLAASPGGGGSLL